MTDEEKQALAAAAAEASNESASETSDQETEESSVKTFTQEQVNELIADRLKRAKIKADEDARLKTLEENNEYKELYEAAQLKIEEAEKAIKQSELDRTKADLITAAGYPADKLEMVKRNMHGETPEELTASLDEFKTSFPPEAQYTDPSLGNGLRGKPEPQKNSEYGKSLYERISKK